MWDTTPQCLGKSVFIVCIRVSTPFFLAKPPPPPWISKLSKPPFQGNPPLILVFRDPPPKSQISHWTPKILKFLILNTIFFFKVTEFLVKISQFKYLVITERNIFACKLFLSLNISDFIFYVKIANLPCPLKVTLLLPSNPLLKVEVLSSPAIFENLVGGSIAPPLPAERREGGVHSMSYALMTNMKYFLS